VESDAGRGTCVEAWFPPPTRRADKAVVSLRSARPLANGAEDAAHPKAIEAGAAPQPTALGAASPATVLIVDDEDFIRVASMRILEDNGFRTLTAAGGREGVELLRTHGDTIAVVLLDMTMPGLTGEQTFHELRKHRPDLPVVLSSGYDEIETRRHLAGDARVSFLQKPYRAEDLTSKIRSAMGLYVLPAEL
jgi:CheY-like chemotaxis protein